MKFMSTVYRICFAILIVCLAGTSAFSADSITLKFAWTSADSRKDPYCNSAYLFKEIIEKKTIGRIQIKLYPNSMLGSEREALEGLTLGTIDLSINTNANIGTFVKDFQVFDLPYLFPDEKAADKVLDGEIGQTMLQRLEKVGIKGLGFAEGGYRMTANNIRPVKLPQDFNGIKIRVMENPIYIELFKALGANPTPMAWPEVITSLQQRTIDGVDLPISVIQQNKINEVCKYLSLTKHTYSPIVYVMSMATFKKLPVDLQKAVIETAEEARHIQRKVNRDEMQHMLEDLIAKGMQVNDISNIADYQALVKPMYEKYNKQLGNDIVNKVIAATQN